jgi:hypothetical protein
MFSSRLAAPFVVGALFILYLSWEYGSQWAIWMAPMVLVSALIYVFSPQINWWYYSRYPRPLPEQERGLLADHADFYNRLDALGKQRFEARVRLFVMGTDWMALGWPDGQEEVPADIQLVLATQAVTLTWNKEDVLLAPFEQVVVYPKPFPSPEYPFAHASELYAPDGCLIFSAEQVMRAFIQPTVWYNVGLHEFAKAMVMRYPALPWPEAGDIWDRLEEVSNMSRSHVESVIGLAGIDSLPVMIHHYRIFPDRFAAVFPSESRVLASILDGSALKQ